MMMCGPQCKKRQTQGVVQESVKAAESQLRPPKPRLPHIIDCTRDDWSWQRDLNPRPSDYKSDALPTELRQPGGAGDGNRTRDQQLGRRSEERRVGKEGR